MDLSWPSGLGTPKRILMVRLLPHLLQWPSKSTYLPQEWRMAIRFSVSLRVLGMITRRSTKGSATSDASSPPALSASSAPARSTPQKPNCGITCAQQEGYILPLLEKNRLLCGLAGQNLVLEISSVSTTWPHCPVLCEDLLCVRY